MRARERRSRDQQASKRGKRQHVAGESSQGPWKGLWIWSIVLLLGVFLGYGVWLYTWLPDLGDSQDGPRVRRYGMRPVEVSDPVAIREAVARARSGPAAVTLEGRVVDMGPWMGCWVLIEDGTGEVLAQTEPMVYMPQKLRGATVRVKGKLVHGRFAGMGYYREGWFLFPPGVEVLPAGERKPRE